MNSPAAAVVPIIQQSQRMFECGLCHMPFQYRCDDCRQTLEAQTLRTEQMMEEEEVPASKKINIASGEDVCLYTTM